MYWGHLLRRSSRENAKAENGPRRAPPISPHLCEIIRRLLTRGGEGGRLANQVAPGNARDPDTVAAQKERTKQRCHLKRALLARDCGMPTGTSREKLRRVAGNEWLSAPLSFQMWALRGQAGIPARLVRREVQAPSSTRPSRKDARGVRSGRF